MVLILFYFMQGSSTTTDSGGISETVESLSCEGEKYDYPFFKHMEGVDEKSTKVNAIFNDDKLNTISLRLGFEVGGILMLIGLLMIISTLHLSIYFSYFSVILLGLGLSISLTYILYHFVGLAHHCERGTANNTYVLFGELSILLGYLFENSWTSEGSERICYIDMLVVLCSLIFFELITRNYYNRQAFR